MRERSKPWTVPKLSLKTAQNRQKRRNSRKRKFELSDGWQRDLPEFVTRGGCLEVCWEWSRRFRRRASNEPEKYSESKAGALGVEISLGGVNPMDAETSESKTAQPHSSPYKNRVRQTPRPARQATPHRELSNCKLGRALALSKAR